MANSLSNRDQSLSLFVVEKSQQQPTTIGRMEMVTLGVGRGKRKFSVFQPNLQHRLHSLALERAGSQEVGHRSFESWVFFKGLLCRDLSQNLSLAG